MVRMRLALPPLLDQIVRELHAAGYRAVVVGGAVRDALLVHELGALPKDFDIEVYGIAYDQLAGMLARRGRIDRVGKSFGVVKLNIDGHEYDFSVPRRDSKLGLKHRDFETTFDPAITPREAASRRDFTINAMAYDPVADELLDFFGGVEDLKNRVLRATSEAFAEDPLRVLRGMQLACRFDLTLEPATAALCRTISDHYSSISRERVADEFMKWAVKSPRPGSPDIWPLRAGMFIFPRSDVLPVYRKIPAGTPKAMSARIRCWFWTLPRASPCARRSKATIVRF